MTNIHVYFCVVGFVDEVPLIVPGKNGWMCAVCNKKYKNKNTLQRHLKYECGKQKLFQCPICNKAMTRKETLQTHLRIIECLRAVVLNLRSVPPWQGIEDFQGRRSTEVRYSCTNCRKHYKNKSHLKRHVQFECGQQKHFQCPVCNRSMTRKQTLQIHLKMIHQVELEDFSAADV
ncbi:hypothetical protein J6590_002398 [Homalodisca vitripennis]|nr:hypothetical protein J6590_002398 [Homalodisca vitripennis]